MIDHGRDSMTARALRLAIVLTGAAYATVLLMASNGPAAGSLRSGGPAGIVPIDPDLVIAYALIGTGAAMGVGGGSRRVSLLTALAGIAWLGSTIARSSNGSDSLRGLGVALEPLLVATLFALVVALAAPGMGGRRTIALSAVPLAFSALIGLLRLATYDPFTDPRCAILCMPGAPFLPTDGTGRLWLERGVDAIAVIVGAGLVLCAASLLGPTRHLRGSTFAAVAGGVIAGVGSAGSAALSLGVATLFDRLGAVEATAGSALAVATSAGGVLLATGLAWWVVGELRVRIRMRRVADDIASAAGPGSLETRLADALNDDSVVVGYWLPDEERYVSDTGVSLDAANAETVGSHTAIERDGNPVATIWHRADIDAGAIRAEITPTVLIALDNERLQAVGLANLRSLRASRARIVTVQEQERRRIERDLHDGVQQRLLAIAVDLRLAVGAAKRDGDAAGTERLTHAETVALSAVEEVRLLARGIHPAVLSQAGLGPALASLADEAPIPMAVSTDRAARLPATVEAAVYQLVVDALSDAVRLGAEDFSVAVVSADAEVVVDIDHDGEASSPWPVRLADRVAAAGGLLAVESGTGRSGRRIRAALPCE
jgi:signal transduction histidine kinase